MENTNSKETRQILSKSEEPKTVRLDQIDIYEDGIWLPAYVLHLRALIEHHKKVGTNSGLILLWKNILEKTIIESHLKEISEQLNKNLDQTEKLQLEEQNKNLLQKFCEVKQTIKDLKQL